MGVNNENQNSLNSLQIVCMCPKTSQNHGHGYTNLGKNSGFFLLPTCPLIARRIIGGNFFGRCFKASIFSSKTSKIANGRISQLEGRCCIGPCMN